MSESTYSLFQQGREHLKKGMAAQATVPLEKAKKREPDKASIREALGIAYFRIHRYDEAEAEFRAMLDISPADDYAHYALGRCLEKQGKDAEANGHYKLASSLRPGKVDYESRIRDLASEPGKARASQRVLARARSTSRRGEIGPPACACCSAWPRRRASRTPSAWRERSRACGSSRTRRASSTAACSTWAGARSSSASSRSSPTRLRESPELLPRGPARGGRAAVRGLLRGAGRRGVHVARGIFGARMQVELVNDGPVTIVLDV